MKSSPLFFFCLPLCCLKGDNKKNIDDRIIYKSVTQTKLPTAVCAEYIAWLCANRNQSTVLLSPYLTVLFVIIQTCLLPSLATTSGVSRTRPKRCYESARVCACVCVCMSVSVCLVTHDLQI